MKSAMRVLVLGASGFVGSAIARAALARGDEVVGLVREGAKVPNGVETVVGSPLDPNAIANAAQGADLLVHALGTLDVTLPAEVYRWLYVATAENAIAAAKHAGVHRMVLVSSTDVTLSEQDRVHWDEKRELPSDPLGPRARAIRIAEEITLASSDEVLETVALRPGWIWGAGDKSRLPGLIREARSTGLRMFGDGRTLISTTHVDVVAEAALAAARFPGAAGQAYYLTDSELLELRELFGAFSSALGLPRPVSGMPGALASLLARAGGGVPREVLTERRYSTHFNAEKARTELGIEPSMTLEQGMKALAQWVEAEGGVDAIAAFTRSTPTATALAAEAQAADVGG
jgi:nucleoside-diphosphate-sugar epimerase